MEVGAVALQMRNSSASELTSVTLEHPKSQSAQIFKIYQISRCYLKKKKKNIAIASKHKKDSIVNKIGTSRSDNALQRSTSV